MSKLASNDLVEFKTGASRANKVRSRVNCSLPKVEQIGSSCSHDKVNEVHRLICRMLVVVSRWC